MIPNPSERATGPLLVHPAPVVVEIERSPMVDQPRLPIADQEIRTEARQTAGSFFDALGATFAELGADIAKQRDQDSPDQPPSDEPMSQDAPESE